MSTPATTPFPVNRVLTHKRRTRARRRVENTDYAAFAHRVISAHGRRVADGDIESLTELADLANHLDITIHLAIQGLRAHGFSWTDIGRGLGISKQAAQQRWGTR